MWNGNYYVAKYSAFFLKGNLSFGYTYNKPYTIFTRLEIVHQCLGIKTFYRPHFEGTGEGTVFTGVCLSTSQVGVPPSGWQAATPIQLMGGSSIWLTGGGGTHLADRGIPHLANRGLPPSGWWGVPTSGLDGSIPHRDWMEYPTHQDWMGTPSPAPIRRQSSRASTCYAAGGMPLAFKQENFSF